MPGYTTGQIMTGYNMLGQVRNVMPG